MSIYTEFAEDVRARQRRLERQQFWFRFHRRLASFRFSAWRDRTNLGLAGIALICISIIAAACILAGIR
jgi:hypothetical protein